MRFKSAKIQLFAKLRSAVLTHLQDISIYNTHSQLPCTKISILNIRKTAKPDTTAVWYCKSDTPMQILYNACKNTSCKIIHATHAKQGATKTEQSRRNCEIKQQFLWTVTLFCNWKTKINFYGGATTNYKKNKGQGFYIFYITKNCQVLQYGRH